jgi:hypothetical protein
VLRLSFFSASVEAAAEADGAATRATNALLRSSCMLRKAIRRMQRTRAQEARSLELDEVEFEHQMLAADPPGRMTTLQTVQFRFRPSEERKQSTTHAVVTSRGNARAGEISAEGSLSSQC